MYLDPLRNLLSKEWKVVSREEARRSPYYGLWGWLLLFYIMALFGFVDVLISAVSVPDPSIVETYGGDVGVMRAVSLIYAALTVPFLILAPMKHRLTPKLWIAWNWISVIIYAETIDFPGRIDEMILRVGAVVVMAALMTLYILISKRVNVTYLNRIPAGSSEDRFVSISEIDAQTARRKRVFWFVAIWFVAIILGLAVIAAILGSSNP